MIGNSTGISIVELWPCKDTFPTFLHGEVVAAVNKMLTDKCITCQKISGHGVTPFSGVINCNIKLLMLLVIIHNLIFAQCPQSDLLIKSIISVKSKES